MKLTEQTLGEQLRITSRDIARRKELFGITSEDSRLLAQAKGVIARDIDSVVEEFYASQVSVAEIERLIGDAETLARLKRHMARYLLTMFDGVFDDVYVLSRLRVGLVHDRIGVPPKLYLSSVHTLLDILRERLAGTKVGGQCSSCLAVLKSLERVCKVPCSRASI